jgi:hypothetical protein
VYESSPGGWSGIVYSRVATLAAGSYPRKVKWNSLRNTWVMVGGEDATGGAPRVWNAAGNGSSWSRVTEIEEAIEEEFPSENRAIYSVAFDDSGNAVYVGQGGLIASSGAQVGLRRGTYNVYAVSYFNTRAGKFAYDFTRISVTLGQDFSNLITFSASAKEQILAANPWMDAGMIDDLRFDVYIQFLPEGGDADEEPSDFSAATADTTIRYAFTEPFPDLPDTPDDPEELVAIGRDIEELPIGRQLGVSGQATTAVFEKSRTALHNGRMWGMASQDEDRWKDEDGISLEIANQFGRFVLSYTEIGWVNLLLDQSFIPIQPTQSSEFTGIMSTPSGLMVMFDNEIFLVTGDPAFGNVAVDLYLDMVGCDAGTYPSKVGGIPFTIWSGKVWMLQAGEAVEVSRGQWRREDPFVRLSPEPETRSLLAMTASGMVFRYILDDAFWLTDAVNRDGEALLEMLPNCTCMSGDYTRFVQADGAVWTTRQDGTPDTPHLVYRDLDFGFPERRTPLYVVKAAFEGPILALEYDRSSVGFDVDEVPTLFYASAQQSNGDTHESVDPQLLGIPPILDVPGNRRVGVISWRLPLRATRGFSIDTRLELKGMGYQDALKPPLRFVFAAGGELR